MRMENIDNPAPNFIEDMLKFSDYYADEQYIRTLHENAGSTLRWVEFERCRFRFLTYNVFNGF